MRRGPEADASQSPVTAAQPGDSGRAAREGRSPPRGADQTPKQNRGVPDVQVFQPLPVGGQPGRHHSARPPSAKPSLGPPADLPFPVRVPFVTARPQPPRLGRGPLHSQNAAPGWPAPKTLRACALAPDQPGAHRTPLSWFERPSGLTDWPVPCPRGPSVTGS